MAVLWNRSVRPIVWMCCAGLCLTGCQNGHPFLGGQQLQNNAASGSGVAGSTPALNAGSLFSQPAPQSQALVVQMQESQRKLAQYDSVNKDLTARMAQAEQFLRNEREQKKLIQQQLAEAGNQLKAVMVAKDDLARQASTMFASQQASQRQVGGATITANNSIRTSLRVEKFGDLEVRQEGSTIRVEIPADRLFAAGTMQLLPQSQPLLDEVAASIVKHYPKQLIVIEGHTDNTPAASNAPATSHQIAAAQSHAVVDYFLSRGRLPANQISSMSFGSHRPRVSNAAPQGQAKNRRIEIVIYPDSIDGKP